MLTFFLRRLIVGVVTFLLAGMVLHATIVPMGASIVPNYMCMHCPHQPIIYSSLGTYSIYKLDRPWPISYFTWLYDPTGEETKTFFLEADPRYFPARNVEFTSLGLLRGDFGQSLRVQPGTPSLAMYGIELLPSLAFISTLLFGSMAVAYLQRRSRQESSKAQRMWLV